MGRSPEVRAADVHPRPATEQAQAAQGLLLEAPLGGRHLIRSGILGGPSLLGLLLGLPEHVDLSRDGGGSEGRTLQAPRSPGAISAHVTEGQGVGARRCGLWGRGSSPTTAQRRRLLQRPEGSFPQRRGRCSRPISPYLGPRPSRRACQPTRCTPRLTFGPTAEMIMWPGAWTQGSPSTCTGVALRRVTRK